MSKRHRRYYPWKHNDFPSFGSTESSCPEIPRIADDDINIESSRIIAVIRGAHIGNHDKNRKIWQLADNTSTSTLKVVDYLLWGPVIVNGDSPAAHFRRTAVLEGTLEGTPPENNRIISVRISPQTLKFFLGFPHLALGPRCTRLSQRDEWGDSPLAHQQPPGGVVVSAAELQQRRHRELLPLRRPLLDSFN